MNKDKEILLVEKLFNDFPTVKKKFYEITHTDNLSLEEKFYNQENYIRLLEAMVEYQNHKEKMYMGIINYLCKDFETTYEEMIKFLNNQMEEKYIMTDNLSEHINDKINV